MSSLLRRTRAAIVDSLLSASSLFAALGRNSNGTRTATSTSTSTTTAFEDLSAFANLSPGTLRSMDGNGQLIRVPISAGIDPGPLAAATYAAAAAAAATTTTKASPGLKAPAPSSRSSSSSSSSSSFSARLDLPSHLGGAGVLGFFTSRYFLILVIVTAVINRIEHICRPRTRPQPIRGWKRVLLKLPALVLLTRSVISLLGVSVMLADSSRQYAVSGSRTAAQQHSSALLAGTPLATFTAKHLPDNWAQRAWLGDLFINPTSGQYRVEARSSTYIWTAFLAAAATVVTEALIKNLEGSRAAPYFNLNGFAYLTHAYVFSPDSEHGYPGSPTWSLFFSMFLQLAELWTLSVVSLWKSRPRSQLPITSIFGIASTIHHLHWRYIGNPTDPLHIMNRFPDAILLAIILLTAFLHALTMAVTEGTIDTSRLFFNASNLPSLTEDYNLALFKLGTACLESTRLSGLSRDLVNIRTPVGTWVEMDGAGSANVHGGVAAAPAGGFLHSAGGVSSALHASGLDGLQRTRAGRGTRVIMDEDEDVGLVEFLEDERDMIVRHRRKRRRRVEAGANEEGVDEGGDDDGDGREVDDARAARARVTALRNGFALEIRDLRTAADGTFARNSLAVLSGTSPTRLAEARRFGLTLLRVIFALLALALAWTWSCIPPVLRLPFERNVWRPTKRRVRRVVRWTRRKGMRYVRLLWHGSIGETRREEAMRARRGEEARLAAARAARIVQSGSGFEGGGVLHAGAATADDGDAARRSGRNNGAGLGNEVALRRAMRAMSPSSGGSDTRFWRAFLAPDAPDYEDEGSDEDGEWREDEEEDDNDDDDGSGDDGEFVPGGMGENEEVLPSGSGRSAVARQLAARASRMRRMRSPSVGLSEFDFEEGEEEGEEEEGALALTLAAQQLSQSGPGAEVEADVDMSQYLLMHLSNVGGSPLTRTRFQRLVGRRDGMDAAGPSTPSARSRRAEAAAAPAPVSAGEYEDLLANMALARRRSGVGMSGAGSGAARIADDDEEERKEWERERQRLCVICQTENRTILIWPCRCLALCDDCRDNLASRPVSGKVQTCPCCRTPVAGFSRLFLP